MALTSRVAKIVSKPERTAQKVEFVVPGFRVFDIAKSKSNRICLRRRNIQVE